MLTRPKVFNAVSLALLPAVEADLKSILSTGRSVPSISLILLPSPTAAAPVGDILRPWNNPNNDVAFPNSLLGVILLAPPKKSFVTPALS